MASNDEAKIMVNGECWGSYGRGSDESVSDYLDNVKETEAYITREAYRELGGRVSVTVEWVSNDYSAQY